MCEINIEIYTDSQSDCFCCILISTIYYEVDLQFNQRFSLKNLSSLHKFDVTFWLTQYKNVILRVKWCDTRDVDLYVTAYSSQQ